MALNLEATGTPVAGQPATLSARLDPAAEGTVEFTSGSLKASAPVVDGVATAELTFPITGEHEVKANFQPKNSGEFKPATASTTVTVAGQDAALNVDVPANAPARSRVEVKATVAQGAEGTIRFRLGDATVTAKVDAGVASAELPTGPTPGQQEITAEFTPAPRSVFAASTASAPITIDAVTGTTIELSADQTGPVRPGQPVSISATVTPAENTERAEGTVTAVIDGRRISAEVQEDTGTATLPLVFPREGEFEVPITFTPANPADAKRAATKTTITVAAPATSDAEIALNGPAAAEKGQSTSYTATLTPQVGSQRNVTGFLEIPIDGKPVAKDGETARIPVVEGIAEFDVLWNRADVQELTAVFHNASGEEVSRTTTTVTVTGDTGTPGDGNNQSPGDGGDNQVTPGGSSSSAANPFAPLIDFFRMLWEWLTSLFSGGSSSSGSSIASRD